MLLYLRQFDEDVEAVDFFRELSLRSDSNSLFHPDQGVESGAECRMF